MYMTKEETKAARALRKTIGINIHALRMQRHMTLTYLSRKSTIPLVTLDQFEMGKGKLDICTLAKLALVLGVEVEALLAVS